VIEKRGTSDHVKRKSNLRVIGAEAQLDQQLAVTLARPGKSMRGLVRVRQTEHLDGKILTHHEKLLAVQGKGDLQ
jgi:hypothetical protein